MLLWFVFCAWGDGREVFLFLPVLHYAVLYLGRKKRVKRTGHPASSISIPPTRTHIPLVLCPAFSCLSTLPLLCFVLFRSCFVLH
ncbi:hypothetical protein BC939DRAFT_441909 [Gamsiella multidivaricata]|uniref:uncharacterized protein n=1 Tax=Gamsiella multidivaricata TaxID=101098 RepID=UPI00221F92E7|nr:uncharacterized protein BC939DRAFT_441909 [Gamsiella multidivaricata]KAI7829441.1 hypothetical protein BC939DRAFT_441909 [Gamsiella multidivaricata]